MTDFAPNQTYRKVRVDIPNLPNSSGTLTALVTELTTGGQLTVPMSAPGRISPQEGDIWQLSREMGYWSFDKLISKGPEKVVSTMEEAFMAFEALGIVRYDPSLRGTEASIAMPPEVPRGAHIGQIRAFTGTIAPKGWLPCLGGAYSRRRYRQLFDLIGETYGAGDGDTTFNVPTMYGLVRDVGGVLPGLKPWNMGWGVLGAARRAGEAGFTLVSAGVETDIHGIGSPTYTINRRYKITCMTHVYSPAGATNAAFRFWLGATLWSNSEHIPHPSAGHAIHINDYYDAAFTNVMATKTSILFTTQPGYLTTAAGDGRASTILVEDVGPSGAAPAANVSFHICAA